MDLEKYTDITSSCEWVLDCKYDSERGIVANGSMAYFRMDVQTGDSIYLDGIRAGGYVLLDSDGNVIDSYVNSGYGYESYTLDVSANGSLYVNTMKNYSENAKIYLLRSEEVITPEPMPDPVPDTEVTESETPENTETTESTENGKEDSPSSGENSTETGQDTDNAHASVVVEYNDTELKSIIQTSSATVIFLLGTIIGVLVVSIFTRKFHT